MLVLTKLSFWQEDWAPGNHSMKFRHFADISLFPILIFEFFVGNELLILQNCKQFSLNRFNQLSILILSSHISSLSFFLKRKDTKHQKSKRGRLTLNFYSFQCLNHFNVMFGNLPSLNISASYIIWSWNMHQYSPWQKIKIYDVIILVRW